MIRRPPRSTLSLHDALPISGIWDVFVQDNHSRSARGILRGTGNRSEEHTSELQSRFDIVCRLLLEKKKELTTFTQTKCDRHNHRDQYKGRHQNRAQTDATCLHQLIFTFYAFSFIFFFNDTATTEIYTLSLHDALPIWPSARRSLGLRPTRPPGRRSGAWSDRKSTRLNSSHVSISYAVFCLKKKKK